MRIGSEAARDMALCPGSFRVHMALGGRVDSEARVLIGRITLLITDRIGDIMVMMAGWLRGWPGSRWVVRSGGMDGDGQAIRREFRGYMSSTRVQEMC